MLTELRVANFALIEQLQLSIPAGFVALTGETGAGKSLLVDALSLLLGQRAATEQIRTGADEAELEAAFSLSSDSPVLARLRAGDILGQDQTEVVLRRILSRTGRGRSYINGRLVSLQELERLSGLLVDIHGQHEQQSLLTPASQLDALDHFGGLNALRSRFVRAYNEWQESKRDLEETEARTERLREREDLLRYQVREIQDAAVQPDEERSLQEQCLRLEQVERLRTAAEQGYAALYGEEGAVLERLSAVVRNLRQLSAIDAATQLWSEQLDHAVLLLQEVAAGVRAYRDGLEDDPAQLAHVQARLVKLEALKKKYGGTLEAVMAKGEELQALLSLLEHGEDRLIGLHQEVEVRFQRASALAHELSNQRRAATKQFEDALKRELEGLHLKQARITVRVEAVQQASGLTPTGSDHVQFLFSANKGEALYPLARVVSGGECSRVMLALKSVLAEYDTIPVLVFDEIDAGVGGRLPRRLVHGYGACPVTIRFCV